MPIYADLVETLALRESSHRQHFSFCDLYVKVRTSLYSHKVSPMCCGNSEFVVTRD